jgi:phosphatidylserine synthase
MFFDDLFHQHKSFFGIHITTGAMGVYGLVAIIRVFQESQESFRSCFISLFTLNLGLKRWHNFILHNLLVLLYLLNINLVLVFPLNHGRQAPEVGHQEYKTEIREDAFDSSQ